MEFPALSGEVAKLFGTSEARLNGALRRGKIPAPPVRGGRRWWMRDHVLAAAEALGLLTPALLAKVEEQAGAEVIR